jgi:hypothetical protein
MSFQMKLNLWLTIGILPARNGQKTTGKQNGPALLPGRRCNN